MKVKKIYAVYFSATGVTEKVVCHASQAAFQRIFSSSEELDPRGVCKTECDAKIPEPVNICLNSPDFRRKDLTFGQGDLAFFGVPVYAGRVPNLLLPYLTEKVKGGGAAGVPIVSYGNRNFDDGLKELTQLLEQAGFVTAAAGAFVGTHAFSEILGADRPDSEDLEIAERLGAEATKKVTVENWPQEPHAAVNVPGEEPLRPYYTPRDRKGNHINILKVKPKTDPNRCNNCGLCVTLCPLGSIDPEDPSLVTGICMKCGACIKKCPNQAKFIDDPGYLYHKKELEEVYTRRGESRIFV